MEWTVIHPSPGRPLKGHLTETLQKGKARGDVEAPTGDLILQRYCLDGIDVVKIGAVGAIGGG